MIKFNIPITTKFILSPSYLHPFIREVLAKEKKYNITVSTIEQYLEKKANIEALNQLESMLILHQKMKKIKSELSCFMNICDGYAFEQEIYNMLNLLNMYQIDFSQLPQENDLQKDCYIILNQFKDFITPTKVYLNGCERIEDASTIAIYDPFPDEITQQSIKILCTKGAITLPVVQTDSAYEFYHATNPRQEFEGLAQTIIENQLQAETIQLCLNDISQQPLVKQILQRYKIPFTCLSESNKDEMAYKIKILLDYALNPDAEHLKKVLDYCSYSYAYRNLLEVYPYDIDTPFPTLSIEMFQHDLMDEHEINQLIRQIDLANQQKAEVWEYLEPLSHAHSIQEILQAVDQWMCWQLKKPEDQLKYAKLQQTLLFASQYLLDKEDIAYIANYFEQLSNTRTMKSIKGVMITDLKHFIPNYPITLLTQCTQNHYPGFTPHQGIFNEVYFDLIKNYPSLEQRHATYMKQLDQLCKASDRIIFTFSHGNYEGKVYEPALEIENLYKNYAINHGLNQNAQPILLKSKKQIKLANTSLSPKTAKVLYTNEHILSGSVSALETYRGCPFAYFLKYGLKLKAPASIGFDVAKIGTLTHYIFEKLVEMKQKNYAQATKEELTKLLKEGIDQIQMAYPQLDFSLILAKELNLLLINLEYLNQMEQASSLTPTHTEYKFFHTYPIDDTYQLQLKGYVDRVDSNERYFRIIDYKSSKKELKEDMVFSGQQLQLLTYCINMKEQLNKKPIGAYYYSTKPNNINVIAGKINRRKYEIEPIEEEANDANWLKSFQLKGWLTSDFYEQMDNDSRFTQSLKKQKDGSIKASKIYDERLISAIIDEMMKNISTWILDGKIEIEPSENSCTFCNYQSICRYQGKKVEKEWISEIAKHNFKKGDKDNGEELE